MSGGCRGLETGQLLEGKLHWLLDFAGKRAQPGSQNQPHARPRRPTLANGNDGSINLRLQLVHGGRIKDDPKSLREDIRDE